MPPEPELEQVMGAHWPPAYVMSAGTLEYAAMMEMTTTNAPSKPVAAAKGKGSTATVAAAP